MNYAKTLSELSLEVLLLLHENHYQTFYVGSRFILLSQTQFEAVEKEIEKRIGRIDFSK